MSSFMKGAPPIWRWKWRAAPSRGMCGQLQGSGRSLPRSAMHRRRRRSRERSGIAELWTKQPAPHHHHQEKGGTRRPSRRRLESRLCRLRHRHDGAVHRAVAAEQQQAGAGGGRRLFQRSHRNFQEGGQQQDRLWRKLRPSQRQHAKLKEELQKAVRQVANFDKLKNQIEMTVTAEGLRIELLESDVGTFFDSGQTGSERRRPDLLVTLAEELGRLPNRVLDRGPHRCETVCHERRLRKLGALVRPRQFGARIMEANGLHENQISQVRGYADQKLRVPGTRSSLRTGVFR